MRRINAFLMVWVLGITLITLPTDAWGIGRFPIYIDRDLLQHDPQLLKHQTTLTNLYQQRDNQPLWLTDQGIKGGKVNSLLSSILRDVTLDPRGAIHRKARIIKQDLSRHHDARGLVELELQLTTLYINFLQHTILGEIDWKAFDNYLEEQEKKGVHGVWVRYPYKFDLLRLLSKENIPQTLKEITPKGYHYQALINKLYGLYKIKWRGGWGELPYFKTLKKGQSSKIVPLLRQRLTLSGDYRGKATQSQYFDTALEKAVKRFQLRHQVLADGIVGSGTRRLLNISVTQKIHQLLLNIDRIKWIPRNDKDPRYLVVNIPEYMLHLYEYGRETKRHRVIVGDPKHPSPIFSDTLSYITLNPYWKIPDSIIRKEVIPSVLKDPNYLKKHHLEIHKTWEENSSIISPKSINWAQYLQEGSKFPYRIMQPPGKDNALGRIKFKFPNKFSVYLHDTPTRYLFKKNKRAFSHGCIRLDKPFSLLGSLAKNEPQIRASEVKRILKSRQKQELDLVHDIPINLVYLTTWVDKDNRLIFGDDIYQYDQHQKRFIR